MYAVIGVALFGEWSCGYKGLSEEDTEDRCADEGYLINFHEFTEAVHLLFRVSTGNIKCNFKNIIRNHSISLQILPLFCQNFAEGVSVITAFSISPALYEMNRICGQFKIFEN